MWPLGQSGRPLWLQEVHCTTPAAATADAMRSAILQVGNGELLCNWLASPHDASFRQAHAGRCRRTNPLANQQCRRNGRRHVDACRLDGLAHAVSGSPELNAIYPGRPTQICRRYKRPLPPAEKCQLLHSLHLFVDSRPDFLRVWT